MKWYMAKFLALAVDPQVLDASALMDVADQELTELVAS
jgi:hypothetical protein